MLPIEEQADDESEAAGAENEKVRKRECEPADYDETYGNDGADWRARNRDGAERRSRAILAGLGRLLLNGFVAECHITALRGRANLGRSCRLAWADRERRGL